VVIRIAILLNQVIGNISDLKNSKEPLEELQDMAKSLTRIILPPLEVGMNKTWSLIQSLEGKQTPKD